MRFEFDPLLEDVVEAAMADWGEDITLLLSGRGYDPATGTLTEQVQTNVTQAMRSAGTLRPREATAGRDVDGRLTLLIRTDALPSDAEGRLRVLLDGRTYETASRSVRPGGVTAVDLVECEDVAEYADAGAIGGVA